MILSAISLLLLAEYKSPLGSLRYAVGYWDAYNLMPMSREIFSKLPDTSVLKKSPARIGEFISFYHKDPNDLSRLVCLVWAMQTSKRYTEVVSSLSRKLPFRGGSSMMQFGFWYVVQAMVMEQSHGVSSGSQKWPDQQLNYSNFSEVDRNVHYSWFTTRVGQLLYTSLCEQRLTIIEARAIARRFLAADPQFAEMRVIYSRLLTTTWQEVKGGKVLPPELGSELDIKESNAQLKIAFQQSPGNAMICLNLASAVQYTDKVMARRAVSQYFNCKPRLPFYDERALKIKAELEE